MALGMFAFPAQPKALEINDKGEVIEQRERGCINWTTRKLEAIGIADPNQSVYGQVKAAQIAARTELLAIFKGIRIRGDYGVIEGILRKDISEAKVEGYLAHSYVTKPGTYEFGLIEAKAFIYLDSEGTSILMPQKIVFGKQGEVPSRQAHPSPANYTGLIIDARSLDLKPAIAPRILIEDALTELYPGGYARRGFALEQGLAGYAGTLQKARDMQRRIGDNPMVIRAERGADGTDVVISRKDATRIASAIESNDFLRECRVIIVVGES